MTPGSHAAVPRPDARRHYPELEGLRALAALAVLLTHAGFLSGATGRQVLPGFLARMDIGVPIFFVLSGFLLYRPHARHLLGGGRAPSSRTYAIRRFSRLVPAWVLALLGTLLLVPDSRDAPADAWLANALQLQGLRTEWDLPGLAQLWSLSTEVAFYLALPALAWLLARVGPNPRSAWVGLLALVTGTWMFRGLVALGALPEDWAWLRTLPGTGDWFAVGMALALVVSDDELRERVGTVVAQVPWHLYGLAACIFWVVTTRMAGPYDLTPPTAVETSLKHLGYTLVAGLVVAPSVLGATTTASRILTSPVLTFLGRISYGIFLWHLPIMFVVRDVLGLAIFTGGFWVTVVVTLALSTVVSAMSWHWVEAPIQSWAHRSTRVTTGSPGGDEADERQRQEA